MDVGVCGGVGEGVGDRLSVAVAEGVGDGAVVGSGAGVVEGSPSGVQAHAKATINPNATDASMTNVRFKA